MTPGPRVQRLLETGLYVEDLDAAEVFWRRLLSAELLVGDDRIRALAVAPGAILLLFRRGASAASVELEGGIVPGHDGGGTQHVAFAIAAADLPAWEAHLSALGIPIESRVQWPLGGTSIYFRDPDEHCVELATPGVWDNY